MTVHTKIYNVHVQKSTYVKDDYEESTDCLNSFTLNCKQHTDSKLACHKHRSFTQTEK